MNIFAVVWIRNYAWELLATERPKISVREPHGICIFLHSRVTNTHNCNCSQSVVYLKQLVTSWVLIQRLI